MICHRSHPHEADESCDGSVRHLYAKGAHDERERIAAQLGTTFLKYTAHDPDQGLVMVGTDNIRAALNLKP